MLKTDYQDDVFNGNRKYTMTTNADGTVSLVDATEYTQEGDAFGAADVNAINTEVNALSDEVDAVSAEVSGLSAEVDGLYTSEVFTATLSASSWTTRTYSNKACFYQNVTIQGMPDKNYYFDVNSADIDVIKAFCKAFMFTIKNYASSTSYSIGFLATSATAPTVDIPIKIVTIP